MQKSGSGNRMTNKLIAYAFTAGVVIAVILGLISNWLPANVLPILTTVLVLAGLIVGFFNVTAEEQRDYVLFVTALVIVLNFGGSMLGQVQVVGMYLENTMRAMMAFILPSVVIVGLKAVINLARD
ncbi:hypothetical protein HYV86_06655 [Candidatus Woesearchaeota archaeon]|nr:hypothetical protein [Candidatus Woesearchaeota archaeon]